MDQLQAHDFFKVKVRCCCINGAPIIYIYIYIISISLVSALIALMVSSTCGAWGKVLEEQNCSLCTLSEVSV